MLAGRTRPIEANERCDRCHHASKYHAPTIEGGHCRVPVGGGTNAAGTKRKACLCDGFFPEKK